VEGQVSAGLGRVIRLGSCDFRVDRSVADESLEYETLCVKPALKAKSGENAREKADCVRWNVYRDTLRKSEMIG
jgi:hypothetical protein